MPIICPEKKFALGNNLLGQEIKIWNFNLNVKHRWRIDDDACRLLQVLCQLHLVVGFHLKKIEFIITFIFSYN